MKSLLSLHILLLATSGITLAQETEKPFVEYSGPVSSYLKRTQQGDQLHAFDRSKDFAEWQRKARSKLIELTGLAKMEKDLASFKTTVTLG
jgi:hypothetical protein